MQLKTDMMGFLFTITRSTPRGIQEVLTDQGWRSRESILLNECKILGFEKAEGSKKIKELRKQCRIKSIAKSMMLNYG